MITTVDEYKIYSIEEDKIKQLQSLLKQSSSDLQKI
jgi:hypothetical protein